MKKYYCLIISYLFGQPDYFFFDDEPKRYRGAIEMYNYAVQNNLPVVVKKIETDLDFSELDIYDEDWVLCNEDFYS